MLCGNATILFRKRHFLAFLPIFCSDFVPKHGINIKISVPKLFRYRYKYYVCYMNKCLRCNNDFTQKNKKKKYCSDLCRAYSNRAKRDAETKDWQYVIDKNGIKFLLDKNIVLKLAVYFDLDVRVPKKDKVAKNKPKIESKITPKVVEVKNVETIVKPNVKAIVEKPIVTYEMPQKKKVDYRKEFESCELPDEFRLLWEKINEDTSLTPNEKKLWKIEFGIK